MKGLLIAEKPSLMREIKSAYLAMATTPYDLDFMSFRGHFMELVEPDSYTADWGKPWRAAVLPMIPAPFKFKVKSDCSSMAKEIKDAINSGKYDFVVNACDTGREGEAIFWAFYNHFSFKPPVKRIWHEDVTQDKLQDALLHLREYATDKPLCNLREASLLRMQFDWLVGMNLSRGGTLAAHKLMSVGRVQTPTLNIIVTRDNDIDNFISKDFFEIEGNFDKYKGTWFNPADNVSIFEKESDAKKLISTLGTQGKISDVKQDKVMEYAAPLYSLGELQKEANRILGFPADKTLEIAQKLYETHKILSYPRTDSRALSTSMALEIPKHLEALKGVPEVSKFVTAILANPAKMKATLTNKKYIDNSKVKDHHALINTKMVPNMKALTKDESDLFLLVVRKLLSIFMDPYVIQRTTIITDVSGEKFKTVGSVLIDFGFKAIYDAKKDDDEVPAVKVGEIVTAKEYKLIGKKTTPPKPFTDGTLIDAMINAGRFASDESKDILKISEGIGTSATRAEIIKKLISKGFIERKGKTLRSTGLGKEVILTLNGKDVISPDLTATWEGYLIKIEDGEISPSEFSKKMIEFTTNQTAAFLALDGTALAAIPKGDVIGKCPACGSDVFLNQNGAFCSKGKIVCAFAVWRKTSGTTISDAQIKKLIKSGKTDELSFTSKAGNSFKSSLAFDKDSKTVKFGYLVSTKIGTCPKCSKAVMDYGSYCKCECGFSISKTICGTKLTDVDIKNLLNGKPTAIKDFVSGDKGEKKWKANLKLKNDKSGIEFEFMKK